MNSDKGSPRQIKRQRASVFILTKDVADREGERETDVTDVWCFSSGNVVELMTRDYWVPSNNLRGLICGPHFIFQGITTLGDHVGLWRTVDPLHIRIAHNRMLNLWFRKLFVVIFFLLGHFSVRTIGFMKFMWLILDRVNSNVTIFYISLCLFYRI